MKVAKLYSFNKIAIEEIPIPEVKSDEILVKTRACGICSGDVMKWYIEKKAPLVLGHEPAGEIIKIGEDLIDSIPFTIGDRVFVHHHAPCMQCRYCQRGDFVHCKTWIESKIIPGGISEYFIAPKEIVINDTLKLPENLSFEDGALIEPVACVVKSLSRSLLKEGDTMLIVGLGFMGQLHVILGRFFGAKKIIGADFIPFRLEKALEFGADLVIDASKEDLYNVIRDYTNGFLANVVIVCPNNSHAIQQGLKCVAKGGVLMLFAPSNPNEKLLIDINNLYFSDITITTSYSCGPQETRRALSFIQEGIIPGQRLITHRFSLEDTERAFRITAEAKDSLKCMIVF
ncbi:MAG: alcohol dehydrogenase catalytic domain-containing protein [Thermodesulfovibrionales bacterium]|nr:alcohol dehydrogenase catalytic domain-containing protein [Thermodesulfovibrionales bacterium]